jgi:hypothetical protein
MRSFMGGSLRRFSVVGAALLLFAAAQSVSSQSQPRPAVIDGVVTDSALAPLGDATVSLLGSSVKLVTGPNGRFQVRDVRPGAFILLVRRIGYEAASLRLQLASGDTLRPSVALQRASTKLEKVEISGQRLTPAMQEFEARRKLGEGQFMTQAQIESHNALEVTRLLSTFTGVAPQGNISYRSGCNFQYFLDGVKLPPDTRIDRMLVPKDLAGIELYLGPATIPLQYKTTNEGGFCGVVLLWTRIGK